METFSRCTRRRWLTIHLVVLGISSLPLNPTTPPNHSQNVFPLRWWWYVSRPALELSLGGDSCCAWRKTPLAKLVTVAPRDAGAIDPVKMEMAVSELDMITDVLYVCCCLF